MSYKRQKKKKEMLLITACLMIMRSMVLIIMADVRGSGSKVFTFENFLIQKNIKQKTKKQEEQMLN